MNDTVFKPIIYLLHGCPFCMKVRVFLLEAGLIDQVDIQLVEDGSEERRQVTEKLAAHLPKVGFPTAELTQGQYTHSASFHSREKTAPSKSGIKHLGSNRALRPPAA